MIDPFWSDRDGREPGHLLGQEGGGVGDDLNNLSAFASYSVVFETSRSSNEDIYATLYTIAVSSPAKSA